MKEDIRSWLLQSIDVKVKTVDRCADDAARAAEMLIDCLAQGHRIYLCGNGGSAADCQHVAAELVGRFLQNRRALPAVALTTDTSTLTAIGNDVDFEQIFARQAEALVAEGDCLVALSTSGHSVNVQKAAAVARQSGARVIALTGEDPGGFGELADIVIAVPSDKTPHIQEAHVALLHVLCGLIEKSLFQEQ